MKRQDIEELLTDSQKSTLNINHIVGFNFLETVLTRVNPVTDDYFIKIEELGKAVTKLNSLKFKAKEKGIIIPTEIKGSPIQKNGWNELEYLGLTLTVNEANLPTILKQDRTPKDAEFLSRVGSVLKQTQMIESLLAGKNEKTAGPVSPPKNPEPKKIRSWEMDLNPKPKKSW